MKPLDFTPPVPFLNYSMSQSAAVKDLYDQAVRLWFSSGVEKPGEGHPGIIGPEGGVTPANAPDENAQLLLSTIVTLTVIYRRQYVYPPSQVPTLGQAATPEAPQAVGP